MGSRYLFLVALAAPAAIAGPIYSPAAVIHNDYGQHHANYVFSNAMNHSGLVNAFTSGVTDFDTYAPSTQPHTDASQTNDWYSTAGFVPGGFVDLDMGLELNLARVAIWNEDAGGVGDLRLYTSNDPTFASATLVGDFSLIANAMGDPYVAEVLDLTETTVRYVRLEFLSRAPGSLWSGISLGEIAFEHHIPLNVVPLPSGAALAGLGLLGVVGAGRRRSAC